MKKEESISNEIVSSIQRAWRHRKGVNLFGRQVVQDNTIPGLILDVFDNLGYQTKDGQKPLIVKKDKKDFGWHLVVHLPPGRPFKRVSRDKHIFEDATKSFINLNWNGAVQMDICTEPLPTTVNYEWDPLEHKDKIVPLPIGMSHKGLVVIDLADGAPHMLIAGETNMGKSNMLFGIIHSLLPLDHVNVCIIDRKEVDFDYLKGHVLVAETESQALDLLKALWEEHMKRTKLLKKAGVKKIQSLPDPPPYFVCVVDEFAQLQNEESHFLIDQFARLSRATGIHLICGTQKPSSKKMDTDTRSQFDLRLCFPVASEMDSRMVLGETHSEAAWLPRVQGRALFKNSMDLVEVQTMHLPDKQAYRFLEELKPRRWNVESSTKRLSPR